MTNAERQDQDDEGIPFSSSVADGGSDLIRIAISMRCRASTVNRRG